jgi:hypothetical protein
MNPETLRGDIPVDQTRDPEIDGIVKLVTVLLRLRKEFARRRVNHRLGGLTEKEESE